MKKILSFLFAACTLVMAPNLLSAQELYLGEFNIRNDNAKDAAAGSVLVLAVCAILVGVCLFGDPIWIGDALYRIFSDAKTLILCLMAGAIDILFLFFFKDKN